MSAVLTFFEELPDTGDKLHKVLMKIPSHKKRIQAIQHDLLGCCGADEKNGVVVLSVIDAEQWENLTAECDALMDKLARIDELVESLDKIFEDAEKQKIAIHRKTVEGLQAVEVQDRKNRSQGRYDEYTHQKIPTPPDPKLVALVERANAALYASGLF